MEELELELEPQVVEKAAGGFSTGNVEQREKKQSCAPFSISVNYFLSKLLSCGRAEGGEETLLLESTRQQEDAIRLAPLNF